MNEEELLDDKAFASSTLLADAVKEAMSVLLDEMKSNCMLNDLDFWDPLEAHEAVARASLEEKVDMVLIDHSYNVNIEGSMDNSLHKTFTPET